MLQCFASAILTDVAIKMVLILLGLLDRVFSMIESISEEALSSCSNIAVLIRAINSIKVVFKQKTSLTESLFENVLSYPYQVAQVIPQFHSKISVNKPKFSNDLFFVTLEKLTNG